jgi:hypothetical protein
MKRWHVYENDESVSLEEGPWWAFVLPWIFNCMWIPAIRFPAVPYRLKDQEDISGHGSEWTTWREWYGDISQMFHIYVCSPVDHFCDKHIRSVDYNLVAGSRHCVRPFDWGLDIQKKS